MPPTPLPAKSSAGPACTARLARHCAWERGARAVPRDARGSACGREAAAPGPETLGRKERREGGVAAG